MLSSFLQCPSKKSIWQLGANIKWELCQLLIYIVQSNSALRNAVMVNEKEDNCMSQCVQLHNISETFCVCVFNTKLSVKQYWWESISQEV